MSPDDASIEARLAALEQESAERAAKLRALAAEVPAAVSRRALLTGAVGDLRAAPNKGEIVRRGMRKLAWAPLSAARRLKRRLTADPGAPG